MDAKQVWRAALGELQVSLSPANYETWLKDTALVAVDDNRFRVAVPNGFAKDWLETRYRSLICQTLARVVGYSVNVEFEVRELAPSERIADDAALGESGVDQAARARPGDRRAGAGTPGAGPRGRPEGTSVALNARYTFRNFIVGSANRLAHAASLSVAERPGHAYNPLFLYGGRGPGQDAPDARHRQRRASAASRASASSTPRARSSPTSSSPASSRAASTSSARATARSTCC